MTLKQIRKERLTSMKLRDADIVNAYGELLSLEKKLGHTGVMCALRLWFNRPKRGKFL
jgi:hypothetical protein